MFKGEGIIGKYFVEEQTTSFTELSLETHWDVSFPRSPVNIFNLFYITRIKKKIQREIFDNKRVISTHISWET
jgi:hypothetical protein